MSKGREEESARYTLVIVTGVVQGARVRVRERSLEVKALVQKIFIEIG